MEVNNLEALWVSLMNRSICLLRAHLDPTKVNQDHLNGTILVNPHKLALMRALDSDTQTQKSAYLACMLTDACTILDILYAQYTNVCDNKLSVQCVELLCDLIK